MCSRVASTNQTVNALRGRDGEAAGDGVSSYALRDIPAGEELTDDYTTYHELPWFEVRSVALGSLVAMMSATRVLTKAICT